VRARVQPVVLTLAEPLQTAFGEVRERAILQLCIEDDAGRSGWGEAAPLEAYDGVSLERCRAALDAHLAVLADPPRQSGSAGAAILDACRAADPLPQALAAVDLALWDLAGRRAGRPVAALLADELLAQVPVNTTIGALDREAAATRAAAAAAQGFACVKLKVGSGDDAGRVAAVRAAAGPQMALRLDANGAWDVEQAVRTIDVLAPAGLELVEEPVHGVDALRLVRRRVATRIAMDETTAEPGAIASGAADAVCLKLARAGGIAGLLAQAALVRATGAEAYLASTFDGPLGIAAALHCAAALRVQLPCGLATLGMFADVDPGELAPRSGAIAVPPAPGLGVSPLR
jgi:L-alanine-DL-glutamate epimerase-like enolase superfamily enzyme